MHLDTAHPRRRLISLTPLIDVVFILLVFFMLASNFNDWRRLTLATPTPSTAGDSAERLILLRVAEATLNLDARPVTLDELAVVVAQRVASNAAQPVQVQASNEVSVQRLVDVLDRLQAVGAANIRLHRD